MARYLLEWDKAAFSELSQLLTRNPTAAQTVIDLAVALAEDPELAGGSPYGESSYHTARSGNWFVVFVVDDLTDRLQVVEFGSA